MPNQHNTLVIFHSILYGTCIVQIIIVYTYVYISLPLAIYTISMYVSLL